MCCAQNHPCRIHVKVSCCFCRSWFAWWRQGAVRLQWFGIAAVTNKAGGVCVCVCSADRLIRCVCCTAALPQQLCGSEEKQKTCQAQTSAGASLSAAALRSVSREQAQRRIVNKFHINVWYKVVKCVFVKRACHACYVWVENWTEMCQGDVLCSFFWADGGRTVLFVLIWISKIVSHLESI